MGLFLLHLIDYFSSCTEEVYQLLIVGLSSLAKGILFRKSYPIPLSCRVMPMFSSRSIYCFRFPIEVFDLLESIFLWRVIDVGLILLHVDIPIVEDPFFSFQFIFVAPLSNITWL